MALSSSVSVLTCHSEEGKKYVQDTANLLNTEWPRSMAYRLANLAKSCDSFPTHLILIHHDTNTAFAHAMITAVEEDKNGVLVESVIVAESERGKGLGRLVMNEVENWLKNRFGDFYQTIYLSTTKQEAFYRALGYVGSEPKTTLGATAKLLNPEGFKALTSLFGQSKSAATPRQDSFALNHLGVWLQKSINFQNTCFAGSIKNEKQG
eukprot:GCRY01003445.1.p1 GENE.GCRY01003445.1~~GCRY01003445.1.p1  ORF type:complete len:208 (-),score=26.60 GCRY01003445.1:53-676(-)